MRTAALVAGLLSAVAFASPSKRDTAPCPSSACLSAADAQTVATHFSTLITSFSAAEADEWLTPGFTDYSSSVNTLIDYGCPNGPQPLDNPTFTSRAAFITGQGSQPAIPWQQLNLWYTCDTVFVRWRTTVAAGSPEDVTGIVALEVVYQDDSWLINTVYSEFNSGAWLVDLGVFTPTCNSTSKRDVATLPRMM